MTSEDPLQAFTEKFELAIDVGPSVVLVLVRRRRYQMKMRMRAPNQMVLAEDWETEECVHHLVLMHMSGSRVKISLSLLSVFE